MRLRRPSASRFQAPARLPIAFQVHTVSGLTPSISLHLRLDAADAARRSRPSRRRRGRARGRARGSCRAGCAPWICRSQAFCEPQEWYIAIGRWVIACSGKARARRRPPPRTADTRTAADRNRSRCARAARSGGCTAPWPARGEAEVLQRLAVELEDRSASASPMKPMSHAPSRDRRGWRACSSAVLSGSSCCQKQPLAM